MAFAAVNLCAALLCAALAHAQVTINFESLRFVGPSFIEIGSSYTESGFNINGDRLGRYGTQDGSFPGSTALFENRVDARDTLTKVGGGTFTLTGIDLAPLGSASAVTVLFTGVKTDFSTVTQSFTTAPVLALQSFSFNNTFTGLTSVSWTQDSPFHQYDNIRIDGGSVSAAAPEPGALGLIALPFVGVMVRRRRSLARG